MRSMGPMLQDHPRAKPSSNAVKSKVLKITTETRRQIGTHHLDIAVEETWLKENCGFLSPPPPPLTNVIKKTIDLTSQ